MQIFKLVKPMIYCALCLTISVYALIAQAAIILPQNNLMMGNPHSINQENTPYQNQYQPDQQHYSEPLIQTRQVSSHDANHHQATVTYRLIQKKPNPFGGSYYQAKQLKAYLGVNY